MKKIIFGFVVVIVALLLAFFYITRPPSAPSQTTPTTSGEQGTPLPGQTVRAYSVSAAESQAAFRIREVLRGSPFMAVGTTSAVSGEFKIIEENGVRSAQMGEIRINARTFKTDDPRRDGAIARLILKSESPENEFIVFKPKDITGLPDSLEPDTAYEFEIQGDLTISGVTKPAKFAVVAFFNDAKISGKASAKIRRSDYNLVIPNIPFVANVDDEFEIEATLVAPRI